jgi:hypothetical protein
VWAALSFRYWWLWILIGIALVLTWLVYFKPAPAPSKIGSEVACSAAREYAKGRFLEDNYRTLAIGDCNTLSLVEQKDGAWIVSGVATATQYGAPKRLNWTVSMIGDSSPQGAHVCGFGANTSGNMARLLSVRGCR